MLDLAHLAISRVAVHHIPSHGPNRAVAVPSGGQSLVALTSSAKDMVVQRLTKVLGKNSNGIKVGVTDDTPPSFFQTAAGVMVATDAQFLTASGSIARALAKAQNNVSLAPCKLIVIGGEVTAHARPFIAVIKAELQEALTEKSTATQTTLDHLKDIFMTESQRLYKVGFLQRAVANPTITAGQHDSGEHSIYLFDHLMTGTETRSAAFYFYSDFLGCDIASSAKSLTRDFFDQTQDFLNTAGLPADIRIELQEALRSELRSNKQTLSVADFAATNMDAPKTVAYKKFMDKKGFPSHAVTKDIEYVKSRLKRRQKVIFSSGVMVTTPADQLNLIEVTENQDGSSTVKIQGTVQKSE
jgi:hypothetical protein